MGNQADHHADGAWATHNIGVHALANDLAVREKKNNMAKTKILVGEGYQLSDKRHEGNFKSRPAVSAQKTSTNMPESEQKSIGN